MSKLGPLGHSIYSLLPTDIDGFDSLAELALDMRWSWNHGADKIWRRLDAGLWELTQNPWVILQTVSRDQLERLWADSVFRKMWTTCCKPNVTRKKPTPGSSKHIPSLP